jgi:hypothetical protein
MKIFLLLLVFLTQANADDGSFCQMRVPCQPGFRCPVIYIPCNDGEIFSASGSSCVDTSNDNAIEFGLSMAFEVANRDAGSKCSTGIAERVSEPITTFYQCTRDGKGHGTRVTADYKCL